MQQYKSTRIIDGKPKEVIVDDNGKIINRNPSHDELKGLKEESYTHYQRKRSNIYTDSELLNYMKLFYKEYGRVPIQLDFDTTTKFPNSTTYFKRFGSWNKAIMLAELDEHVNKEKYTDDDLLNHLKVFYQENGRSPTAKDFEDNPEYPRSKTYHIRFGGWSKALKLVGLDVDTMVLQGVISNNYQKRRLAEILVRDHFEKYPIDLSGENPSSPCDGICPNGKTYDVKSAGLLKNRDALDFHIRNKYKEEIEIFYLLGFNRYFTELLYVWRVPGEIIQTEHFTIGIYDSYEFNMGNMIEYEITDKFKGVISKILNVFKDKEING